MGTTYYLLRMGKSGKVLSKNKIKGIHEPSQLTWDGNYLWISSWYSRKIYKVEPGTLSIVGHFSSPVSDTTGIFHDGEYFWVTGTRSDLYKLRVSDS